MNWVTTGEPTIQKQRSRWAVRVAGYGAATGRRRVRQLGTHATRKAALAHQRAVLDGRAGSDDETLSAYLREVWLPSKDARVEVSTYDQYRWDANIQRARTEAEKETRAAERRLEFERRRFERLGQRRNGPRDGRPVRIDVDDGAWKAVRLGAVDLDVSSARFLGEIAEAEAHRLGWRALRD